MAIEHFGPIKKSARQLRPIKSIYLFTIDSSNGSLVMPPGRNACLRCLHTCGT